MNRKDYRSMTSLTMHAQAHLKFEENFWSTKMGLNGASSEALAKTKTDYESERIAHHACL